MDSPPPAPWTYAARAAYFGDRVCPFCDRHNPAGAKFCNDCGSPLHLKPCNRCGAVNEQAATNCYKCGAECPALFTPPVATPVLPAADVTTPARATAGDVGVAATVPQPLFAAGSSQAGWRLAGIATILIAGAYAAYRINAATPDAMEVASQPIGTVEHNAPTAASFVLMAVESKPVEPAATAPLLTPVPSTNLEAPKRASTRQSPVPVATTKRTSTPQRPVPVAATKRTSTPQRPAPEVPVAVGATPPVAKPPAAAPVAVAETRKARQPDPREAMHVSLATCGGDLIARMVCDQRVRRRFCEGHWGEAPECTRGVANDRGQ
jgi:ribosomal protein L40E